jgi:roadblock/LC7 domain-containing protein
LPRIRTNSYQSIRDVATELEDLCEELKQATALSYSGSQTLSDPGGQANRGLGSAQSSGSLAAASSISSSAFVTAKIREHRKGFVSVLLLAVAAVGIGFAVYKFSGSQPISVSFESANISRLTSSGKVTASAISADGKWVVYANRDGEQQSLWLQQVEIAGSNTRIVPSATVDYLGLAFSPDGNLIFYTLVEKGSAIGAVYQVPVLGGTPRKLIDNALSKVSFSPDGKRIAYYSYVGDEDRLIIANNDGSGQRVLAARRGNEFLYLRGGNPVWSPDGTVIVATVGTF